MSIGYLNVGGLNNKLNIPEFVDYVQSYDILLFGETKTDDTDVPRISEYFEELGYCIYFKNRFARTVCKSGGLAIVVKLSLVKYVRIKMTTSKAVQWMVVDKEVLSVDQDMLLGNVYIPPEGTRYTTIEYFTEIERELSEQCEFRYVCVCGDMNGYTSTMNDFVEAGRSVDEDMDDFESTDSTVIQSTYFDDVNIQKKRSSMDKHRANNYGHKVIEMCKACNLLILNGRVGVDKLYGRCTCNDKSVVDYVLADTHLITLVSEFEVLDYEPVLSDVHSPIVFKFMNKVLSEQGNLDVQDTEEEMESGDNYIRWIPEKKEDYVQKIDINKVQTLMARMDDVENQKGINDVTELFGNIMIETAASVFGTRKTYSKEQKTKRSKPWFDAECREKRKAYARTKRLYKRFRTAQNKECVRQLGKTYKRTLTRAANKYRKQYVKKLENLKSSKPKEYWQMLRTKPKKKKLKASMEDLLSHFRELGGTPEGGEQEEEEIVLLDDVNDESINADITEEEIRTIVNNLKNGKSPGVDRILNEYIKATIDIFVPFYVKLFNKVLNTGNIPDSWVIGRIIPIYKNNGDPRQPENYRGITLVSCFGKMFTALLNKRLGEFSDDNEILKENQAGYRPRYGSTDHIFLLKCVIDLYLSKNKKLFCAFVDYRKAFDTIWRSGLWNKLINSGIKGKILRVIQSMYSNIKSCVSCNGKDSEYFGSFIGVRQGENLSPFLFSVFVNDLEQHLLRSGNVLDFGDLEVSNWLRICVLLYADDTIIMADSAEQLQRALDDLKEYCNRWKLHVNESKTKVIIFAKRKPRQRYKFKYGDTDLDIVDSFPYLGIVFGRTGRFDECKKARRDAGENKMYSLLGTIKTLGLPLKTQLELFDRIVQPVLLYGCETWGVDNNEVLEKIHLLFCKTILKCKLSTDTCLVYGELGRFPLDIVIKVRMLGYWAKLLTGKQNKLCAKMYSVLLHLCNTGAYESPWLIAIRSILENCGLNEVWLTQSFHNTLWLKKVVQQTLKDQFIQKWRQVVQTSSKCVLYQSYKDNFEFESYLCMSPPQYRIALSKLRMSNHKLSIERGRYRNVPRHQRLCDFCESERLGDEYHFLLECSKFQDLREQYIPKKFWLRPNMLKFIKLIQCQHKALRRRVGRYVCEAFSTL